MELYFTFYVIMVDTRYTCRVFYEVLNRKKHGIEREIDKLIEDGHLRIRSPAKLFSISFV